MKLYVIVLNYNNFNDTEECIDSLKNSVHNCKILIVDNNSTDGSREKIQNKYRDTCITLFLDKNVGYAAGNNAGIKYALENDADYICVLNNDTIITEDFVTPCIETLEKDETIGFVSPAIIDYQTNRVQSTGGDIVFKRGLVTVKNNGANIDSLPRMIESDYLGGACLIFRSNLAKTIGLIPENYFLFFEETEWCWKAKIKGLHNICITKTSIKHKGSASIDTINGLHAYLMERNRVVFLKRNALSRLIYLRAIIFLILKYTKKGFLEDRQYFNYLLFMRDGINNTIDSKYSFIYINSGETHL